MWLTLYYQREIEAYTTHFSYLDKTFKQVVTKIQLN